VTADRRAIKLNIDEAKFLEAIDREGDHEIGAGTLTSDRRAALVERVGRALAENAYAQTGITLTDPYTPDADHWNSQATAAIDLIRAEVLEEAAVVFSRYENDPFTASVVADHLRRMKEAP
jgi:hypothetical protein